ncbi:unnamed protein product, partial [marine sediment metagenome]
FKDMALSILPHLLKKAARQLNLNQEIIILTATSGDTGYSDNKDCSFAYFLHNN